MAIEKGDLILASDVVEFRYQADSPAGCYAKGDFFVDITEEKTLNFNYAPGHKVVFNCFQVGTVDIASYANLYVKNIDSETWTFVEDIYLDNEVKAYTNATRDFKEFKLEILIFVPAFFSWGITSGFATRNDFLVTPLIAEANENIRVLNPTRTALLAEGANKITTELYDAGRIGYA